MLPDYYALLDLTRSSSTSPGGHYHYSTQELKNAYHNALLRHHPDKQPQRLPTPRSLKTNVTTSPSQPFPQDQIDIITQIQDAYRTLSDPILKKQYDILLSTSSSSARHEGKGPRPAQIISLEDFDEDAEAMVWTYPCRCGGDYKIREEEMERGVHLAGCGSCSEVVWVGYEVVDEDEVGDTQGPKV